jgi:hypothetical protein
MSDFMRVMRGIRRGVIGSGENDDECDECHQGLGAGGSQLSAA